MNLLPWTFAMVSLMTAKVKHFTASHRRISVFSKALDKLRLESEISAEGYQPSIIMTGSVGRPKCDISHEQLEELLQSRFSVSDIAHLLGVSVSTIRRRMSSFNLSVHQTYTCISDDDLDAVIMEVQEKFPNWGNCLMYGYLITSRIRVPFHRVRKSQRCVDPEGSFMRKLRYLHEQTPVYGSRSTVAMAY